MWYTSQYHHIISYSINVWKKKNIFQLVGLRGKLQETPMIFTGKSMISGFDFPFFCQPIESCALQLWRRLRPQGRPQGLLQFRIPGFGAATTLAPGKDMDFFGPNI